MLAISLQTAAADMFTDPLDGRFDASGYLAENAFGFLPVPMIITEPAVDGGLGLTGLIFHEEEDAAEARRDAMLQSESAAAYLLPPNVSVVAGLYTGNGSWMVGGGHMGFFREGTIRYQGGAAYGDFELDYYSIGDQELPRALSINSEFYAILQSLKFKLGDLPIYIGPLQRYVSTELSPGSGLEDLLPPDLPPEIGDGIADLLTSDITTSALGLVMELDTRDNVFTPTRGFYYEFNYGAYRDEIGSDIDYDWYQLTGLNYFPLSQSLRGGLRLAAESVEADDLLPPFAQPAIDLRGVPAARYQGSRVGVVEAELTWQIDKRWSVLGFVGAGWAAESFSDFDDSGSEVARGLGFRYQIARRYGFHMGIDIARGPEDTVWYIQAGSAW